MAQDRKPETLRRLRVGDLRRYCRWRYGSVLPDDDAGRKDLFELLLPISLDPVAPGRRMANTIAVQAPWMSGSEAEAMIEEIQLMSPDERRPSGKALGKRLNLTNAERERSRLWTIHPADMSDAKMAEHRKAKKRFCERRRRQQKGARPRKVWLANALTRQKPWEAEGISRASWYRRQKKT